MQDRRTPQRSDQPLAGPDVDPAEKGYAMAGQRPPDQQSAVVDVSEIDHLGRLTSTHQREAEAGSDSDADVSDDTLQLELLTELELRDGETDDPLVATEEGLTYVPPIDPPTIPGGDEGAVVAAGFGGSALDEAYDADHHSTFLTADDEVTARVREALHADSATSNYAERIMVSVRDGVVTLRGLVDDLVDSDSALGVASYVAGVEEVIDELDIRGL